MDGIETKTPTDGAIAQPGPDQALGLDGAPAVPSVEYSQSGGLMARLAGPCDLFLPVGLSLHAGPQPSGGGVHVHQAAMSKPMGLYWQGNGRLTLAGGMQILRLENVLAPQEKINNTFDVCFVPRTIHATGRSTPMT